MTGLAIALTGVLLGIAFLHLLWAIGFWFPIREERLLARAIVGSAGVTRMPGAIPCALVAVALTFAGILPQQADFPFRDLLMPFFAAVCILRGIAAYIPVWRALVPEEPFATLDRRYYGPLCLALGIGYLILVLGGF